MLASAESIEVVANAFRQYHVGTSVVDPVCLLQVNLRHYEG